MGQYYYGVINKSRRHASELYHYGVPGMKWGVRKQYQPVGAVSANRRSSQSYQNMSNSKATYKQAKAQYKAAKKAERQSPEAKAERAAKLKRAAKIGAAIAVTALAAYGAYKVGKYVKTKNGAIAAQRGFETAEKMWSAKVSAATSGAGKVRGTISAGSGAAASRARAQASNDNFRTAFKNVVNYARSGQSLRDLPPAEYYERMRGSSITFG